jgi:hypothetical protein
MLSKLGGNVIRVPLPTLYHPAYMLSRYNIPSNSPEALQGANMDNKVTGRGGL